MQKRRLKSTTSLVMSLALIAQPVLAQDTAPEEPAACAGLTDEGVFAEGLDLETLAPTFPCLGPDAVIIADLDALRAAIDAQLSATAGAEAAAEEMATETEETAETTDTEVVEDADAVDDTTTVVEDVQQEPADPVETTEGTAEDTAIAETDAEPEPVTDAPIEAAPEETVEDATDPALPEGDDAAVIADTPVVEEDTGEADVASDESAAADTDAAVAPAEEDLAVDENAEADVATDETNNVADEIETVTQEAEPETPPAAAEVDIDAIADAEAETVNEDDVRRSNQDFETAVTDEATSSDDDDEGLTDFQQALLLGLGAVVVGSVLDNGDEVVSNSGDRVVVERNGELVVLKDDDVLLRQPGSEVQTQTFDDGSTLTVVTRADNTRIVTIRGVDGRVMQRKRVFEDGSQVILFDDTQAAEPVDVATLPVQEAAPTVSMSDDVDTLREILLANQQARFDRTYSLRQVRTIREVRELAPEVELDTVTFATGSAAIDPSQAEELVGLGNAISDIIEDNPGQVFLIEGHTDAVGDAGYNLALSDRRAETVALALTEYFGVPPENLITQGYGESNLKIATLEAERQNRRAAARNITQLLQ